MKVNDLTHAEAALKALLNILADEYLLKHPTTRHRDMINHFSTFVIGITWDQYLLERQARTHNMKLYTGLVKECRALGFSEKFISDVVLFRCPLVYRVFNHIASEDAVCLEFITRLIKHGYYSLVDEHNFYFVALLGQVAGFYREHKGFDKQGNSYEGSLIAACPVITGIPFKWIKEGRYHGKPVPIKSRAALLKKFREVKIYTSLVVINRLYPLAENAHDLVIVTKS